MFLLQRLERTLLRASRDRLSAQQARYWASRRRLITGAWLAIGLLGAATAAAQTQTPVSGSITEDIRWGIESSPYVLTGDVVVRNGAVVTIDAGVDIDMADASSMTVESGSLRATGSSAQPVRVRAQASQTGTAAAGAYGAWSFGPGSTNSKLEHVRFENGSGLVVQGASPVFNYLDIRNQSGAAIRIDLAASPTGVGNRASGNGLNGIAVPAGDIIGSIQWGLLGIPYIVQSGTVSVGNSPVVTSLSPATIERGQAATIVVDGSRLDGLARISFGSPGLSGTPFSGGTASRATFQVKANADATLGATTLKLLVDAGELIIPSALVVTPPLPAVTSIVPNTVFAGAGATSISVLGRNFAEESEVLVNSAVVPAEFLSSTELRASLPNQTDAAALPLQVRTPDAEAPGEYLTSNDVVLSVQMPVPPAVSFEPTPIAMPPDGKPHNITMRLSKADVRDHTVAFSVSDNTKASVAPSSLVIAAGSTSAIIAITPLVQGSVTLHAKSSTLGDTTAPVFITQDFRGLNTSYAMPVGVFLDGVPTPIETKILVQGSVGVGVGAVLDSVSPGAWTVGTTQEFEIGGAAIPQGSQVAIVPSTGLTVSSATVEADGSVLRVAVTATADAAPGPRRVVVRDNNGSLLTFADASEASVLLAPGLPRVDSVSPIQVVRNSSVSLVVRGQHLQGGRIEVVPGEGIEVDAIPQISDDGTQITAKLRIAAEAELGARVIRVATLAGATSSEFAGSNTMHVVDAIAATYSSVAPIVGVLVGNAEPTPDPQTVAPILTANVGLVVGATATGVAPRVGIIGETVNVTVRGQGLLGISGVSMVPDTGLVLGTPTINADGSELAISLQIDAGATLGLRRLVLSTTNGPLAFANVADGAFLISAPLPVVESVTPQALTVGGVAQTLTVRGRFLSNISDVRVVPDAGVLVNRTFTVSSDGTTLDVAITVDAAAATGSRTLIVTTAAGDSSSTSGPGNSFTLSSQLGQTYPSILSGMVGVLVGQGLEQRYEGTWVSPLVGVMIPADAPPPVMADTQALARPVRVQVGAVATGIAPDGMLQGASGMLRITGNDLHQVTSVAVTPASGVLFETASVNETGTEISVPVSIAADASTGSRRLTLVTSEGEVIWASGETSKFGVGRIPTMDSITPILLTVGEAITLNVRGKDLANVTGAKLLPGDGTAIVEPPVWSQDTLGELLKVTIRVDGAAALGDRVLQLLVPGGATTETPAAANTVKLVQSQ